MAALDGLGTLHSSERPFCKCQRATLSGHRRLHGPISPTEDAPRCWESQGTPARGCGVSCGCPPAPPAGTWVAGEGGSDGKPMAALEREDGCGPLWFGMRKSSKSYLTAKSQPQTVGPGFPEHPLEIMAVWGWDRQPQHRGGHVSEEGGGTGLVPAGHTSFAQHSPSIPQISTGASSKEAEKGTSNKHCLKSGWAPPPPNQNSAKRAEKVEPIFFLRAVDIYQSSKSATDNTAMTKPAGKINKITGFLRSHNYCRGDDNNLPFPAGVSSHSLISHPCPQPNKNGCRYNIYLLAREQRRRANQM